jgi:hypothetical protein
MTAALGLTEKIGAFYTKIASDPHHLISLP